MDDHLVNKKSQCVVNGDWWMDMGDLWVDKLLDGH